MSEALGKDSRQRKLDSKANVEEKVLQPLEQLGKHVFGGRRAVTAVLVENSLPALGFDLTLEQHQEIGVYGQKFIGALNVAGSLRIASTSRFASGMCDGR